MTIPFTPTTTTAPTTTTTTPTTTTTTAQSSPIAPSVNTTFWLEKRWRAVNTVSPSAVYSTTPVSTRFINELNYLNALPPGYMYSWERQYSLVAGKYKFAYTCDDGMRIYIDNVLVIDRWSNRDQFSSSTSVTVGTTGIHTIRVELWAASPTNNGDAILKFNLEQAAPTAPTPTAPVPEDATPTINLADFVAVSITSIDRTYIKDSYTPIPEAPVGLRNTSSNLLLRVTLRGINGIYFEPSTFDLNPGQEATSYLRFNLSEINNYPEGYAVARCIVDVTSLATIVIDTFPPTQYNYYNATRGVWVESIPANVYICPPGGTTFYEFGDPQGPACLAANGGTSTGTNPTTPPAPTGLWYNATQGIIVSSPTPGAYICPPGGNTFYELGDEDGPRCLSSYGVGNTTPTSPTDPAPAPAPAPTPTPTPTPTPPPPTTTEPAPAPTGIWYNATRGRYESDPNGNICPPGSTTFYEYGDPEGDSCLAKYGVDIR